MGVLDIMDDNGSVSYQKAMAQAVNPKKKFMTPLRADAQKLPVPVHPRLEALGVKGYQLLNPDGLDYQGEYDPDTNEINMADAMNKGATLNHESLHAIQQKMNPNSPYADTMYMQGRLVLPPEFIQNKAKDEFMDFQFSPLRNDWQKKGYGSNQMYLANPHELMAYGQTTPLNYNKGINLDSLMSLPDETLRTIAKNPPVSYIKTHPAETEEMLKKINEMQKYDVEDYNNPNSGSLLSYNSHPQYFDTPQYKELQQNQIDLVNSQIANALINPSNANDDLRKKYGEYKSLTPGFYEHQSLGTYAPAVRLEKKKIKYPKKKK